jgi:hypothetical protein
MKQQALHHAGTRRAFVALIRSRDITQVMEGAASRALTSFGPRLRRFGGTLA